MDNFKQLLAEGLRKEIAGVDVRTDQCDLVRVIAAGILVGITLDGSNYVAKVISLEGESGFDFDTKVEATLTAGTVDEIVASVGNVIKERRLNS